MAVQTHRGRGARGSASGYDIEVVHEDVDGETVYVASHPDLPRVYSQGRTVNEALDGLAEVRAEFLRDMKLAKVDIPAPKARPVIRIIDANA